MFSNPKVKSKSPYPFLSDPLFSALQCNGISQREHEQQTEGRGYLDLNPVVKLFTPDAQCTWLLTEITPETDNQNAFGLCDLGLGCAELGYVHLPELAELRGVLGLPIERDKSFNADYPLTVYAEAARQADHITEDRQALEQAQERLKQRKA